MGNELASQRNALRSGLPTDVVLSRGEGLLIDLWPSGAGVVRNGVVTEFGFPEHSGLMVPLAAFIAGLEGDEACEQQGMLVLPKNADCAHFILQHPDEFALSYKTNS